MIDELVDDEVEHFGSSVKRLIVVTEKQAYFDHCRIVSVASLVSYVDNFYSFLIGAEESCN